MKLRRRKVLMKPRLFVAGIISVVAIATISGAGNARTGDASTEELCSSCGRDNRLPPRAPFDVRAALGKAAEHKEEYRPYYDAMNAQVGDPAG